MNLWQPGDEDVLNFEWDDTGPDDPRNIYFTLDEQHSEGALRVRIGGTTGVLAADEALILLDWLSERECKFWNSMSGICTIMWAGSDAPFTSRKGLHRLGTGFQELEVKRAEAKIAHRIVQIPLMEFQNLQTGHIGDREQLTRSFFLKEAKQRSMHQLPQFAPLPFPGEAEALGSERFAVEATSHKGRRGPHILFKWIRIALCIVGDGGKMLSEQGFTQLFSRWRCWSLPTRRLAVLDQFVHTGVHALKRVVNDLLMFGYHHSSVLYFVICLVYCKFGN